MLDMFTANVRSLYPHRARKSQTEVRSRFWPIVAIATLVFGLAGFSARADDFYTFQSVLSSGNTNWCIDVPGGDFQPGKRVAIWNCNGTPSQIFGFESGSNLTAGGLCLDALPANRSQQPGAGDPVATVDCDGSNHQVWELTPFEKQVRRDGDREPGWFLRYRGWPGNRQEHATLARTVR